MEKLTELQSLVCEELRIREEEWRQITQDNNWRYCVGYIDALRKVKAQIEDLISAAE